MFKIDEEYFLYLLSMSPNPAIKCVFTYVYQHRDITLPIPFEAHLFMLPPAA